MCTSRVRKSFGKLFGGGEQQQQQIIAPPPVIAPPKEATVKETKKVVATARDRVKSKSKLLTNNVKTSALGLTEEASTRNKSLLGQ